LKENHSLIKSTISEALNDSSNYLAAKYLKEKELSDLTGQLRAYKQYNEQEAINLNDLNNSFKVHEVK
jgi:hypothetical protein